MVKYKLPVRLRLSTTIPRKEQVARTALDANTEFGADLQPSTFLSMPKLRSRARRH